jgi:hypothetical protein
LWSSMVLDVIAAVCDVKFGACLVVDGEVGD